MAKSATSTSFKPGQSGNPGGKPKNAKNKLQAKFFTALADDFEAHGPQAIIDCRLADPVKYLQIVAMLMPKQIEQVSPLDELNDVDLIAAIEVVSAFLAGGAQDGTATAH